MKNIFTQVITDTSDNSDNIAVLKKQFPQCFDKHGAFILEKFNALMASDSTGFALSKEGYSLNWLGKSYARVLANEPVRTFLSANTIHNQLPDNIHSKNILIKGDNLEVLKHLKGAYSEAVKMIYIDPPYNTGSDGFVYNDDRQFTIPQLCQLAGITEGEAKRILEFTNNKSNSHSAWLTFIYPRLYIARQLLRDDGVIFISIDDNEQAQLKILCDEVFGEENFVGQFIWQTKNAARGVPPINMLMENHEYILCFSKTKDTHKFNGIKRDEKDFSNPDNDKRGLWRSESIKATGGQNNTFTIQNLETNIQYTQNWAFSEKTLNNMIDAKLILFPKDKNGVPRQKKFLGSYTNDKKAFVTNLGWHSTENSTKYLMNIFDQRKLFDFPKPVGLLKFLIAQQAINQTDIILDFFAGSGTTAHAVMELNAEDNGNRQFICVQIDEKTSPDSEAYKAGYTSIFDITHERIKRAATAIKNNSPLFSGDLGFKEFETVPVFDGYLDEAEELTENLVLFDGSSLSTQERQVLLQTWAIHDGLPLHEVLIPIDLAGYTAYQTSDILYFIEPNLNIDTVICLLEKIDTTTFDNKDSTFAPRRLVLWPYGLDSKILREFSEAIKCFNNRKNIVLTLDVRY